jgi:hypothetical protein
MKKMLIILSGFLISVVFFSFKTSNNKLVSVSTEPEPSEIQKKLLELALQDSDHAESFNSIGNKAAINFSHLPDSLKNCGGLCFKVAKNRVEKAFLEVTGKSIYSWLPKSMATKYLTEKQVFDWTWNINTQDNEIWRSIPNIRAAGSPGAMQMAGLGEIKHTKQVWNGELLPGAVMQCFVYASDFMKVLNGIDNPGWGDNLSSYGHSFIFLDYVKNEYNEIEGMRIADQGFMNKIIVSKNSFQIWWGANIKDPQIK